MKKNEKAITLIALVITIIVILILAGVAIAALKNTGLIGKTKDAQLKSLKADAKEKIELAIIEVQTEKTAKGEEITLKTLHDEMPNINKDITADDYTEGAEELTGTVISGSKTFNYSIDKKLKVTIEDEADEKAFRVEAAEIEKTSFKIEENGTKLKKLNPVKYTYVADTGDTTTTKKIENITEMPYTVTDLQPATTYKVYVIAYDNSGNATESNKITVTTKDPEITYETVAVNTTNNATTSAPADSITKGTPLYINIVAKLEGQACTVTLKEDSTKTAPYAVTKNGKYTFTVKGTYNGKTITGEKEVTVDQFKGLKTGVVKYDAGTWTQAEINALGNLYNANLNHESNSALNQTFGGFKAGDSRNDSIPSYVGSTLYTPAYSGWEILTSEVKNGKKYVTKIVHAGAPENYVYWCNTTNDAYRSEWILSGGTRQTDYSVSGKSPRKWDMYIDNSQRSLISEVHAMTYDDANAISSTSDVRRNTGAFYWLASAYSDDVLWGVSNNGYMGNYDYYCWGVRPVVSLQSGVYISGGSGTESDPYILAKE